MKKRLTQKVVCTVLALLLMVTLIPQTAFAADYSNTGFLNFAMESNLIRGHVVSIDGKTDFTVENGCVVLEGGFAHKDIGIRLQLDANFAYQYCVAGWSDRLNQYNDAGVIVTGQIGGSNEVWRTIYPQTDTFAHTDAIDITLKYGPYSNVHYPVYGKRVVEITLRRLGDDGDPEGGATYRLPLLFVAPAGQENASASVSVSTFNSDVPELRATWKLGANSNITAAYQWYEKVNGSYTAISGATGQTYTPAKAGTYKVDVTLTANSLLSGVKAGTYKASAETTVSKSDVGARITWNKTNKNTIAVTLNDPVSVRLYADKAGKFVLKKGDEMIVEKVVARGEGVTLDWGSAKHDMAGGYTWTFTPDAAAFYNVTSGTLNLTVNKLATQVSASMSPYISTADYKGSIEMQADRAGVFTFATNGKTQDVPYTAANTAVTLSDLSALIPAETAVGSYTMNYTFTPENAADYATVTGTMPYTIDEGKCDLVPQQADGGTVKVGGSTEPVRASVGQTYEIVVTPATKSSTQISSVKTITIDGVGLEESALTRNSDGSVKATYTVPADGENRVFTISAVYDLRKLVLKNNQNYYLEDTLGFGDSIRIPREAEAWRAVFDAENSAGIDRDDVTIEYYQGTIKSIFDGSTIDVWMDLGALGISVMEGSNTHSFGTQATEQIRISVNGTNLIDTVTVKIIKITPTLISSKDAVAIEYTGDGTTMHNDMVEKLQAKIMTNVLSGSTAVNGTLQYTDENGNAIDWSKVKAGDTLTVKMSYAGEKNANGGYSASSKTATVYIRPAATATAVDGEKTYTGQPITFAAGDFTAAPNVNGEAVTVLGVAEYYDRDKQPCTIVDAGDYFVKLKLEDVYGEFTSAFVPVKVNPAVLTIDTLTAKDRVYDGKDEVEITQVTLAGVYGSDDVAVKEIAAKVSAKNVGAYTTVKVSDVVLEGADVGNYIFDSAEYGREITLSAPVTISQKEVTIIGTAVKEAKWYDGTTTAIITNIGQISTVFAGDDVTIQKGKANYDDAKVGKDKVVTFTDFALTGADSGNYLLTAQPAPTTAKITVGWVYVDTTGSNPSSTIQSAQTGDSTTVLLWLWASLLSASAAAYLLLTRKRAAVKVNKK